MQEPTDERQPAITAEASPSTLPNFGLPQWFLVGLLCIAVVLLLANKRKPNTQPVFESVSMVSAKADYYIESFTLMSAHPDGSSDYTLSAETLIHLPDQELARVDNPSLRVSTTANTNDNWQLVAATGVLPDHGKTIDLEGGVQLNQLTAGQPPIELQTPSLRLDRQNNEITSDAGVSVAGSGWELTADKMIGHVETGQLIFRENNHVQYTPPQHTEQ